MATSRKLDELRARGLEHASFREGYEARAALIRLGSMLKQLREKSGLTQEELAVKVDMTQPTISRLESGFGPRGPEMDTVARFVHGCDFELVVGVARKTEAQNGKSTDTDKLALQTML